MSGYSGEVKNWLPGGGDPGKYVTILDLKERWVKMKQLEEEERHSKLKEVEKKHKEEDEKRENKVCERLGGFKICSEDRSEVNYVGEVNGWLKSGGRGRRRGRRGVGGRDRSSDFASLNSQIDVLNNGRDFVGSNSRIVERSGGIAGGQLVRDLEIEKSVYKKKGLEVDNVRVSDGTTSLDVGKIEKVGSLGDGKETKTNCPCHSKSENQGGGGFWVCKYVEQAPRTGTQESVKGNDPVDRGMVDLAKKKNCWREDYNQLKNQGRGLPRKVREGMTVEQKNEMGVNPDFHRIVNHDNAMRKSGQQQEKWEMAKGMKEEVTAKQMRKEKVDVDKDSRRMIDPRRMLWNFNP